MTTVHRFRFLLSFPKNNLYFFLTGNGQRKLKMYKNINVWGEKILCGNYSAAISILLIKSKRSDLPQRIIH